MDATTIVEKVREHYSEAAQSDKPKYSEAVAKSFGYSEEDLEASVGANLGLSCGNPLALASIRAGETIIDLGSGAGFDVFLASPKVGPTGHVYGIDFNDDMLTRANQVKASKNAHNVTFIKADITTVPLVSHIADCVISNCVINLVPDADKPAVFKEIYRLLKPGGRVAVSDILAKQPLSDELRADVSLYVGCVAGAGTVEEYVGYLRGAGFDELELTDTHADLNVHFDTPSDGSKDDSCCKSTGCCAGDNIFKGEDGGGKAHLDLNAYVASYKIFAVKL